MMTYHIRQRLVPRRGNSFYRDMRVRPSATFCGAECTAYDAGWADRHRAGTWMHAEHGEFTVCETCKSLATQRNRTHAR